MRISLPSLFVCVVIILLIFSCTTEDSLDSATDPIVNQLQTNLKLNQFTNRNIAENIIVNWEHFTKTVKDDFEICEIEVNEKNPSKIESNVFQSELKYALINIKKEGENHSYLIEAYSSVNHDLYSNSIQNLKSFTGTLSVYDLNGNLIGQLIVFNGKSKNPSNKNALLPLNESINLYSAKENTTSKVPECYVSEHIYAVYTIYTNHYVYVTVGSYTERKYSHTSTETVTITEPISVPCGASEDSYDIVKRISIYKDVIDVRTITQIIEDNINYTQLDPCPKGVMDKLKNTTTADITNILKKLGANSMYTVNMVMKPAATYAEAQKISKYNYEIRVDRERHTDGTKLFKATALIHEVIHAYFFSILDDYNNTPSTALPSFPELFETYVKKEHPTSTDQKDAQHLAMANRYVDAMASALQEYDANFTVPYQVYKDLAWGGLSGTPIFNETYKPGSAESIRILNRYRAESSGHAVEQGTPNVQTPVGKPCN